MESHWKRSLVPSLLLSLSFLCFIQLAEAKTEDVSFKKEKITLAGKTITVEVAQTDAQRQHGLMNRKSLPANEGMLFVFDDEDYRSFWMKNTLIDLSIGYFNKDQVLVDVQEMTPLSPMEARPTTYPSAKPAMYALEMNKAWFSKNKIKLGDKFKFDRRRQ